MSEFNSVEDFLNHRGSESSGAKRLKGWAKDPGFLNFWLHTKVLPTSIWYHRIPELVVRPDKNDSSRTLRNIWPRQHACWEDESILKKQRFRTADGTREHPPKKCGLCRLSEAVREMIKDGVIKDTDVLFEFKGADKAEENTLLHAGGFANVWRRDMDEDEKKRLGDHGIYMKNSWKENGLSKLSYIFVGVNQDDVASGVQIAVQTQDVGDKVKRCINNEIASNDGDKGNPFINPYCVRLIYKPDEKEFGKRYDALRINKYPMTQEIERLIRGERPNLSRYTDKFNQKTIWSMMEQHATEIGKKLPWAKIFDVPQLVPEGSDEGGEAGARKAQSQVPSTMAPPAGPPAGTIPCDDCEAPMREDQAVCGKCGAKYAIDAPVEQGGAQGAPAAPPPAAASPEPEGVYDDADVPF